jgi:hypothetical protein
LLSIPLSSAPGLSAGDVIRYDVPTSGYTASKADTAPNSEVFGVVESYSPVSNSLNVVIYGSIALDSNDFADMGSAGGCGGNDIYFLSGQTAGVLQNLAPNDLDQIIKPVYQAAPHGSFTGVVVNYLGYKIGGEIQASFLDGESVGSVQTIIGDGSFDEGYVDASISHDLPIADYPEFYSQFGTDYGYIEKIVVSEPVSGSITPTQKVTQTTSSYKGTIVSVDYGNKAIYVSRDPGVSLASASKKVEIATNSTTVKLTPVSREVYSVYTPVVNLTQPLSVSAKNGTNVTISQNIKVGIKVKPLGIQVSVPTTVSTSSLTSDELSLGSVGDVETVLNDFESRIAAIETRLRM